MKDVLGRAGVPTAAHGAFTEVDPAVAFLDTLGDLFVVKTDGLAAGKGVLVTEDRAEAEADIRSKLAGDSFGDAGRTVVIEEGLTGPELSVLAVCDGRGAVALAPAQDFKRIDDGDAGPNTGGMGAYSPVPAATPDVVDHVMTGAVEPTLAALRADGIDYRGVLYAGLMLTPTGPKMLEYNVRFGDPEAQVVLPSVADDLTALLAAAAAGHLPPEAPVFDGDARVTVVCATEGYPVAPRTGDVIQGLDSLVGNPAVELFCAGVGGTPDRLVTAGGRVLAVTGRGPSIEQARAVAYDAVAEISWPGMHHRTDIAAHPSEVHA
jgi:phosphoribosylamine--glycine ligase